MALPDEGFELSPLLERARCGDRESIEALASVLLPRVQAMVERGMTVVRERFSVEAAARSYLSFYSEAVSR